MMMMMTRRRRRRSRKRKRERRIQTMEQGEFASEHPRDVGIRCTVQEEQEIPAVASRCTANKTKESRLEVSQALSSSPVHATNTRERRKNKEMGSESRTSLVACCFQCSLLSPSLSYLVYSNRAAVTEHDVVPFFPVGGTTHITTFIVFFFPCWWCSGCLDSLGLLWIKSKSTGRRTMKITEAEGTLHWRVQQKKPVACALLGLQQYQELHFFSLFLGLQLIGALVMKKNSSAVSGGYCC